jgi:cbb3-type cytochrome oxidase subunit 1
MISKAFLCFGILFAIVGMCLGIYMAGSDDHTLAPLHAHINLVGWVTMFLAGLFYFVRPECQGRMAMLHLALAVIGLLILAPGLAGVLLGYLDWGRPLAAIGSILTLASMLVFGFIVITAPARARLS